VRSSPPLIALLAIVLLNSSASAQEFAVPPSARGAIVDQTNAYRQGKGLAPLSQSAGASQVAQVYANHLARTNKRGHRADGRSPPQRLRAGGVKFCKFRGENWHVSWTRPKRVSSEAAVAKAMRFWKKSPGHERALRSTSTEIGVGVAGWKHGNQWYYQSVQLFIDTSCLKGDKVTPSADEQLPPLPDRNPGRIQAP